MKTTCRLLTVENDVCRLLVLRNKKLAVCSTGRIEIINPETKKVEETISTYDLFVWCITELIPDYLIYSCFDENIYIWNFLEHKQFHTFEKAHQKCILKLVPLSKEYVCSCSDDKTIKIWDIQNKILISTFEGHQELIYSMVKLENSNFLVSVSKDKVIIWDWVIKKIQLTYTGFFCSYQTSLIEFKNFIIIGGEDRIYLIDKNSISQKVDCPIKEIFIDENKPRKDVAFICRLTDELFLIVYAHALFFSDTNSIEKCFQDDYKEIDNIAVLNKTNETNLLFYFRTKIYKINAEILLSLLVRSSNKSI